VGNVGIPELIFIFVLALLIFGPRKLPELGRTLGKALAEFRRASMDLRMAVEEEMRELERHAQEIESKAKEAVTPPGPELPPPSEAIGSGSIAPPQQSPTAAEPAHSEASGEKASNGESSPA
jgi:TatA/E family protein of Tat protein translocase